jgi:diacylglycerol kinase
MFQFIKKRILSFIPAFKGLFWLFRNEANAQVHLLATCIIIIAGFYFKIDQKDWLFLCFAIGLVISAEALNTSIEKLVDLLHPQKHQQAGLVKDLAAAGVLIASIVAVIIAFLVFVPKFF